MYIYIYIKTFRISMCVYIITVTSKFLLTLHYIISTAPLKDTLLAVKFCLVM